jgi:hypothetical protein
MLWSTVEYVIEDTMNSPLVARMRDTEARTTLFVRSHIEMLRHHDGL